MQYKHGAEGVGGGDTEDRVRGDREDDMSGRPRQLIMFLFLASSQTLDLLYFEQQMDLIYSTVRWLHGGIYCFPIINHL